jgi:CBS domain-containing protein
MVTAATVMTPNPRSINQTATVREAAEILHKHGLHIAAVIDDAGRPVGVVSRTDLPDYCGWRRRSLAALTATKAPTISQKFNVELPGDELTVGEIMTPIVFGVAPNASIDSVVEKMMAWKVRSLFVTDCGGVLVGTISVFEVLRHLVRRKSEHARTTSLECAHEYAAMASKFPP